MSPGSPTSRRRFSSEEDEPQRTRKRTIRSESISPPHPEASRPRIDDISHEQGQNWS